MIELDNAIPDDVWDDIGRMLAILAVARGMRVVFDVLSKYDRSDERVGDLFKTNAPLG